MPSLNDLIQQTMMFKASSLPHPIIKGRHDSVTALVPAPTMTDKLEVRQKNPVWSWDHDGRRAGVVSNIASKVRGMGMNYAHPMPVCTSISLDEVRLATPTSDVHLPVLPDYVIRKYYLQQGRIPAATSGFWRLEQEIDQSLLVVFGYNVVRDKVTPITEQQIERLGDAFMPPRGGTNHPHEEVGVDEQLHVWIAPQRVVVCLAFTTVKERNDYEPGGVLGVNRLYPHVMVMTSAPALELSAVITVSRPAKTMHAGRMPAPPDGLDESMHADIDSIFIADTNRPGVLPQWHQIFDYYDLEPFANGTRRVVMVDPKKGSRVLQGAIEKLGVERVNNTFRSRYIPFTINKWERQGEFDNIHQAPKMAASTTYPPTTYTGWGLNRITMAPFCVHDCLHMHVRWGPLAGPDLPKNIMLRLLQSNVPGWLEAMSRALDLPTLPPDLDVVPQWTKGFDKNYNPYVAAGMPMVPHDQKVTLTLQSPSSYSHETNILAPMTGQWHVMMHNGIGYANDVWKNPEVAVAHHVIETLARATDEPPLWPGSAQYNWSLFYWRLRFGGTKTTPMERIKILNLPLCRT
jgi:hypothetical protein